MMLKNILPWAIVGGICLLSATPLIVAPALFFPFITGKAFFFRIVVEILFGLWLVLIILDKNYRPKSSWLLWSALALGAVSLLAAWFGVNPGRSFWSNFERMEGVIGLLHIIALFVVAGSVVMTRAWWRLIVKSSIVISALVSLYALTQLLGWTTINQGGVRVDATFGNATYLAVYLLFNLFLVLIALTRVWSIGWQRYFLAGLAVLQLVVLYYTATRGVILGLIGGLLLAGILIGWHYPGRLRKLAVGSIIALAVLIAGFILFRDSDLIKNSPVLGRFAAISVSETTTQSRLIIWRMSLQGFKERPLLGWGQENYGVVFNKYYDPALWRQEAWFDRSHNVLLDWLVATGLLGLIAYLSLFVGALWLLWRRVPGDDWLGSPLAKSLATGLLAAYFFQNLFVFDNLISYIYFFLLLAYLHQVSRLPASANVNNQVPVKPLAWFGVAAALALMLIVVYQVNATPLKTARGLIKALSAGDPKESVALFEKTVAYNSSIGDREIREQLLNRAEAVSRDERLSAAERQAFLGYAAAEMDKIIAANPEDARLLLFAGSFLSRFGKVELAAEYLERARIVAPNKQSVLFAIASNYLAKNNYAEAEKLIKQAYESDPSYLEARKFYGLILLMRGKTEAAREVLEPAFGTIAVPDPQYINWFAQNGQYDLVLAAWQKLAPANPGNVQYQFSLAAAYLAVGRRAESVAVIKDIMARFPDYQGPAQKLIDDINAGRNPLSR